MIGHPKSSRKHTTIINQAMIGMDKNMANRTQMNLQTKFKFPQLWTNIVAWATTLGQRELSKLILITIQHNHWRRQNWLVNREGLQQPNIAEIQLVLPFCNLPASRELFKWWYDVPSQKSEQRTIKRQS